MLTCNTISAAKYIRGNKSWALDLTREPIKFFDLQRAIVAFLQKRKITASTCKNSLRTDAWGTWQTTTWEEIELDGETTGELHVAALVSDWIDDDDDADPQHYGDAYRGDGYAVLIDAHEVTIERTTRGALVRIGFTWTTEER